MATDGGVDVEAATKPIASLNRVPDLLRIGGRKEVGTGWVRMTFFRFRRFVVTPSRMTNVHCVGSMKCVWQCLEKTYRTVAL